MDKMKVSLVFSLWAIAVLWLPLPTCAAPSVPLYRMFELQLTNEKCKVENKFADVWLNTTFRSPSGTETPFWGFYDGGSTWRMRYMPDQVGQWTYTYKFSDGTMSGQGEFDCVAEGASPGILRAYKDNPHWFAYNGDHPIFLRSFYNKAGGAVRQDPKWACDNFYKKLVDRGYNHHMSSGFLPVLPLTAMWDGQPFADGPKAISPTIYTDDKHPSTSMQLDVWASLEGQLQYLNDHDIALDFFQGFTAGGPDSGDINFKHLSHDDQVWWVSYVVARLTPYANLGGFVYKWETTGNDTEGDLLLARLLESMDPFNHLRTYEDQDDTHGNNWGLEEWSFASVEAPVGPEHHTRCLIGYGGKPVYMCEGRGLWRSWWKATEDEVISMAWFVTTAAASFTWSDMGYNATDPYYTSQAFVTYGNATKAIDVLYDIMTKEVVFYKLVPADELLKNPPQATYCMADAGNQYLVYSDLGEAFSLDISAESGAEQYSVSWFDVITGARTQGDDVKAGVLSLTPPSSQRWVVVLRAK